MNVEKSQKSVTMKTKSTNRNDCKVVTQTEKSQNETQKKIGARRIIRFVYMCYFENLSRRRIQGKRNEDSTKRRKVSYVMHCIPFAYRSLRMSQS